MSKVVFIAGMHRSGTSMITRLLNLCGVYLGSESDLWPANISNSEGYWENRHFTLLNDRLLSELDGGWDYPPKLDIGWEKSHDLFHIRSEALKLIQEFSTNEIWGWKDPRNSLTHSFWNELIPSMKIVICVRNPVEVAGSLLQRNHFSPASAFNLWLEYNQRLLLSSKAENRIITSYESYFHDPYAELVRVLNFLELDCPEASITDFIKTIDDHLRHNRATLSDLIIEAPTKLLELYQNMCNEASVNQVFDAYSELSTLIHESIQADQPAEESADILSMRLKFAKQMISEKNADLQELQAQLQARENDLQRLETLLNTKEENLQTLQSLLSKKEWELTDIHRSKAWRFIHFIRKTRKLLLR